MQLLCHIVPELLPAVKNCCSSSRSVIAHSFVHQCCYTVAVVLHLQERSVDACCSATSAALQVALMITRACTRRSEVTVSNERLDQS
jgi:hypothetical protein